MALPELINEEKVAKDFAEASKQLTIFADVPYDDLNETSSGIDGEWIPNINFTRYYEELLRKEKLKRESAAIKAIR